MKRAPVAPLYWSLLLTVACSGSCGGPELPQRTEEVLGRPAPLLPDRVPDVDGELPAPVCEASSILMLSDHTWLVADNEIHERLFGFTRSFDDASTFAMPGQNRPRDIEAMARVGEAEFLVVGSHSNRRDGSFSEKRHRLRWLAFDHQAHTRETHFSDSSSRIWRAGVAECMDALFEDGGENEEAFCAALVEEGTMDIEGAATLGGETWLGFRRPLVNGRAVMARLQGRELRFDSTRLVDLGGRGIRAMDSDGGALFIIGGPVEDAADPHVLFRVESDSTAQLAELPPYSEGLAIHSPGHALITTDGDQGENGVCAQPSRVLAVDYPVPEE